MNVWNNILSYINEYFYISSISVSDIIEILIIAFCVYEIMVWFKKTQAWALFKGIVIILILIFIADIFNFSTILWIADKTFSVGVIAVIIIFQPELRRALEQLGKKSISRGFLKSSKGKRYITENTEKELLGAVGEMASVHTGALICIERDVGLSEYENTGISIDSAISRQLILNIFEDKTPLHDGAMIIVNNRIASATCYLPLSENLTISKKYGTRHRAAVGLSEVTDAFIIVVSEETGHISLGLGGQLVENISLEELERRLDEIKDDSSKGWIARYKKKKEEAKKGAAGSKEEAKQEEREEIPEKTQEKGGQE